MDQATLDEQRIFAASCGAMMVGTLLAAFLGGLASLQTALFFGSSKGDHWGHKASVFLLWLIDVLQLCFIFHATYYYVITEGVWSPGHAQFIWSLKLQIFLQTLVMSATKLLYTIRMWKLRRLTRKWIPIVLFILLAAEYGLGSYFAYEVTTVDLLQDVFLVHFKTYIFLAMAFNCATDIIIAIALVYTLVKSRPSLEWTNSNFTMLAAYVINTGGITGFFSLVALIGFAIGVTSPLYIVFVMALPQLYVNCFLSMLNASYYFQTKSSLDLSISYRNQSTYNLEIPRAGFGKDGGSLLRRPTVDSFESINGSEVTLGMTKSADTINEVGLPLFRKGSVKPAVPIKTVPVEVTVQTTQSEYSIDRRMMHHDRIGPIGDVGRGFM
ncbi:hypothetical protein Moror_16506 [Moniliophthora roreri MCA 2997]|uniref:DUF6534 domain-containing protein n=1 Tax=Moniliophthora roreri (strain MCA 2997) TaxID=1381753 RepID=V2WVI0_MONRO|nr:hypothetical protein Moror_16506 [Moniliophthora roreri MCA 2997]